MKKWEHPSDYFGATYEEYYILLGRTRDSDDLTDSNFETALARLGGESEPNVIVARSGHWACGWVEFIGIHQDASDKVEIGNTIESELSNYPVLDESDYWQRQETRAREYWEQYLSDSERKELKQRFHIPLRLRSYSSIMQADNGGLWEYLTTE